MKQSKSPIISELKAAALEAYQGHHPLEAVVIVFQTVEALLRLAIQVLDRQRGVPSSVLVECAEKEQRFSRLITYLTLIDPANGLNDRLRSLNQRRNNVVHKLFFEYQSLDQARRELRKLCRDAVALNSDLQKLIGAE